MYLGKVKNKYRDIFVKASFKIYCSDCSKPLMNFIESPKNQENKTHAIQPIECPFCGGSSLVKRFKGNYHYGPIGKDESINPTTILSYEVLSYDKNKNEYNWKIFIKKG